LDMWKCLLSFLFNQWPLLLLVVMNLRHMCEANWFPTFNNFGIPSSIAFTFDLSSFHLSSITHICSASNFGISGGEVPIVTPSMDPQRKKKKKKGNIHWVFKDEGVYQYQSSPCFISRECFSSRFFIHFTVYYLFLGV
jgi:hypothetical protein